MRRSSLALASLLQLGGPAVAQSSDTPPSTPGNPSARAYGPTAGGVAWQRSTDDDRVVGYEITRDGTVLGVRDTLSYVADDLAPGRGYNLAIVAIDSAGQHSGRALARIETPDARPNRPVGLSANVYSATAAGITWQRSGVFGERYEVKRDGEVVAAATRGTSYVDTTLSGRRPYLFEVIAVNRQGQRSAAARLFVRTSEGTTAPPTSAGPAAPGGLRPVPYSSTAGAIAWDRASTAGLRYEVSRDGAVVATTGGTSFVDDALAAGSEYRYEVVAIDGQGRRSEAAAVTLVTPGARPSSPVNPSSTIAVGNREKVLADVLAVIDGDVYRPFFARLDDVLLDGEGTTLVSEERGPQGELLSVFECEGGGRIAQEVSGGAQSIRTERIVDGCRIDGVLFDGELLDADEFSGGTSDDAIDLSITLASGETTSLVGSWRTSFSRADIFGSRASDVTRYVASGPDGPVTIEAANSGVFWNRVPGGDGGEQSASFSARVTAPWSNGEPLAIRTGERFEIAIPPGIRGDGESYARGSLIAEAADGSRLTLEADNGDPASFTLTVEADGGVSAFTVPVGDGVQVPCIGTWRQRQPERELPPLACEFDQGARFR